MDDCQLAHTILRSLNIAILRRIGPKQYKICGKLPEFYDYLYPPDENGPCTRPWEHSPMLEFFIDDAEAFFEEETYGELASGIWQEDGKTSDDVALSAQAAYFGSTQTLIIRVLQHDYSERAGILRKARERLLENRFLTQNLEMFKKKARFDGLTQLINKQTFNEILQEEMLKARTVFQPLSLIIMDIDNFKKVNDTYGHVTGDAVLQNLGEILVNSLRQDDIVARYGGEEFVVLIPASDKEKAAKIAEKLRKAVKRHKFLDLPTITISLGCTSYNYGEAAEEFIERADKALYQAKANGKNLVVVV